MEFTKESFNGVFKATLDSLVELPSSANNSKKLDIYKLIVAKFHYFVYYLLAKQINIEVSFQANDLNKLQSLLQKVKSGKFEVSISKEDFEVSLETLSNILIRADVANLNRISGLNGTQTFNSGEFFEYFIEKNFAPEDQEFFPFLEELSSFMIAKERAKEHLETIRKTFAASDSKKVFHAAQKSRAYATYSAIGESVQKQSISSNAGWQERIQWIIDTFSAWSNSPASSKAATASSLPGKSYAEYSPNNILLFGPPGTGKTRASMIIASAILNGESIEVTPEVLNLSKYPADFANKYRLNYYSTQFHPSYSYEDFFEGLRPIQTLNGDKVEVSYCVVPGIFKAASQIARAYLQPKEYGIDLMVQMTKEGDHIKWELSDNSTVAHYRLSERPGLLTYNEKPVALTGEITGASAEELKENSPENSGLFQVKWFYHGEDKSSNFVLFIDELNRGNPAKIFGEALCLIEESKRIGKAEKTEIILPYSHESFAVPPNLHIICAMNSADKSLSSLDQAFRRRFKFIYLAPSFDIVTTDIFKERSEKVFSDEILESLKNHFITINSSLKATRVPQENYIGHSYLMKLLRASYLEEKKTRGQTMSPTERKSLLENLVRKNLRDVWESELHGQIREIVGDNRLQEFCDNFASEVSKVKSHSLFLAISQDISKSLYDYLDNLQPTEKRFPWKSAA